MPQRERRDPVDAHELLPPEVIEHWATSGERLVDDFPADLAPLKPALDEYRAEGHSELEIACIVARMVRLAREERFGLIERVDQTDGSVLVVHRDPFEGMPTTAG